MRPYTSLGLRARHSSGPSPNRSVTPGRKPSMSTSAASTSRSTAATPSGCLRSTPTERRPRARRSDDGRPPEPRGRARDGAVGLDEAQAAVVEAPGAGEVAVVSEEAGGLLDPGVEVLARQPGPGLVGPPPPAHLEQVVDQPGLGRAGVVE